MLSDSSFSPRSQSGRNNIHLFSKYLLGNYVCQAPRTKVGFALKGFKIVRIQCLCGVCAWVGGRREEKGKKALMVDAQETQKKNLFSFLSLGFLLCSFTLLFTVLKTKKNLNSL